MSDSKVSELTPATGAASTDLLYLVQSGADKQISISTLLANLPNVVTKLSGIFVLGGIPQTVHNTGTITTTQTLSVLTNTGNSTVALNNGSHDGQIKVLICTDCVGTTTLSNNIGVAQIAFSSIGHSAILIWYAGVWWPIGGTATISF